MCLSRLLCRLKARPQHQDRPLGLQSDHAAHWMQSAAPLRFQVPAAAQGLGKAVGIFRRSYGRGPSRKKGQKDPLSARALAN